MRAVVRVEVRASRVGLGALPKAKEDRWRTMSKPRLLDLFCGAGPVVQSSYGTSLRILRQSDGYATRHQAVLLCHLRPTESSRVAQDSALSRMWDRVSGTRTCRCKPTALLAPVRQTACEQDDAGLGFRTPRRDEAVQHKEDHKGPGRVAAQISRRTYPLSRAPGRKVHRLWGGQSALAASRLQNGFAGDALSAPTALRIRQSASRRVSGSLCQPPLRTDADRAHRGDRHYSIAVAL